MKPLACNTASGNCNNNNNYSLPKNNNFHLIGVLNPGESTESRGWFVIATSTSPVHLDKQLDNLSSYCPTKLDCNVNNWKKTQLTKVDNKKENQHICRKSEILLIPVDNTSGDIMMEDCIRLDKRAFTSGENSHFATGGSFISQEQWKVLADMVTAELLEAVVEIKDTETGDNLKLLNDNQMTSTSSTAIKTKSGTSIKWTNSHNINKESELAKDVESTVKRVLSSSNSHGKNGITKRNKATVETGDTTDRETGSKVNSKNQLQQLIRIEMKPDAAMQNFSSGDTLQLKVTMYLQDHIRGILDHHLEIDFVQNYQYKTVSQKNACRSRRITKVLKRTTATNMSWEKGIHISGQHFELSRIPYTIPNFAEDEIIETENDSEEDNRHFLDNQFEITNSQFELQIRIYEIITSTGSDEESRRVLAACSCFPLNIIMTKQSSIKSTQCLLPENLFYPIAHVEDKDFVKIEEEKCETGKPTDRLTTLTKSLSATEFDV